MGQKHQSKMEGVTKATIKKQFFDGFIYITHDLSTARYVGDSIIIMRKGRIVEKGPIDEVLLHPVEPYTKELINAIPDICRAG